MSDSNILTPSFGGTAYLGIPQNTKFLNLVTQGMSLYGINHGASRNNNLTLSIYSEAEFEIARRFRAEDAIILSSGYLAAQLVVQKYYFSHRLIYAPDTHPALWIGLPLGPKCTYENWISSALEDINSGDDPVLIITNSLNNLYPEIYDFEWLRLISSNRQIDILIDDSHGIGITGPNGEGVYHRIPQLPNVNFILVASMAKGLGIDAGIILGSRAAISDFRTSPIYIGSSPPSPGLLFAWLNASELYSEQRQKLIQNINFFSSLIETKPGIYFSPGFPVFLLKDEETAKHLREKGIQISSFPYPNNDSPHLNRIVISSLHEMHHLKALADAL